MGWERATAAVLIAFAVGCASGGTGTRDTGVGPPRDSGPRMDAATVDAGPMDTGPRPDAFEPPPPDAGRDGGFMPDAADVCGMVTCTDLQYCMAGVCVDYPNCRGDGTCPTPGDVCRARRCVPGTLDIDGDGDPAATDCDESNPRRSSRLPEVCDTIDNNCNGAADDGDPTAMCLDSVEGGTCMAGGVCGCPAGTYDIDRTVAGCECVGSPGATQGASCTGAIDLGNVPDTRGMMTVTGNAIGRDVWYRFRAVDTADATCDEFNVGVHLSADTAATHEIWVVRGACDTGTTCTAGTYTDYNFAMDFREDRAGMLTGQCPCWTGTPVDNVSPCADNSTDMFVRVRRREAAPRACTSYTLSISNGVD